MGGLEFDYVKLATAGDEQQDLLVFLPADEASSATLRRLVARR